MGFRSELLRCTLKYILLGNILWMVSKSSPDPKVSWQESASAALAFHRRRRRLADRQQQSPVLLSHSGHTTGERARRTKVRSRPGDGGEKLWRLRKCIGCSQSDLTAWWYFRREARWIKVEKIPRCWPKLPNTLKSSSQVRWDDSDALAKVIVGVSGVRRYHGQLCLRVRAPRRSTRELYTFLPRFKGEQRMEMKQSKLEGIQQMISASNLHLKIYVALTFWR